MSMAHPHPTLPADDRAVRLLFDQVETVAAGSRMRVRLEAFEHAGQGSG